MWNCLHRYLHASLISCKTHFCFLIDALRSRVYRKMMITSLLTKLSRLRSTLSKIWRRSRSDILSFSRVFFTLQPASWMSLMMYWALNMLIAQSCRQGKDSIWVRVRATVQVLSSVDKLVLRWNSTKLTTDQELPELHMFDLSLLRQQLPQPPIHPAVGPPPCLNSCTRPVSINNYCISEEETTPNIGRSYRLS